MTNKKKNDIRISSTMTYILRHNPEEFDLEIERNGWINLYDFVGAVKTRYPYVSKNDILRIVKEDEKGRYQLGQNRIRAVYGHSCNVIMDKEPCLPPVVLYHGTTKEASELILNEGLSSKNRNYVCLSEDTYTARKVGKRRTKEEEPVILEVNTMSAYNDGIEFYNESEGIWQSQNIPAKYINIKGAN